MAQRPRPSRSAQRFPTTHRPAARGAYPNRSSVGGGSSRTGMILILVIIAVMLVIGYVVYDKMMGAFHAVASTKEVRSRPVSEGPPPALLTQPFNLLLIGVDFREVEPTDGARSDTLIVVHVDPVGKWASMLSIPRDSCVAIPYKENDGNCKINGAYSWGFRHPEIYPGDPRPQDAGAALAAETVEGFLGIPIDYTAQIDFHGFQQVVDAINGITIDVPHAILDAEYPTEDFGYTRLLIEPGLQRMDGETALRYARTRHADSDFGRGPRQQQVIQAALSELRNRGILAKAEALPQLLDAVRSSIRTTLPIDDIGTLRGLASLAQQMGTDRIQRLAINPDTVALDQQFDNLYDIHWNADDIKQIAQKLVQMPEQVVVSTTAQPAVVKIQVWNGKGIKGLARKVSTDLEIAGFQLVDPADAPSDDNPHTMIMDYSGNAQVRDKLASYLKLDPEYVRDMSANKADAPYGVDIVVLIGQDYQPPLNVQGSGG